MNLDALHRDDGAKCHVIAPGAMLMSATRSGNSVMKMPAPTPSSTCRPSSHAALSEKV